MLSEGLGPRVSKTFRHNILYVRALQVVKLGNMSVPLFNHAVQRLLALEKELNAMAEEEAENKSAGLCGSETLRCTSPATLSEEIPNSGTYAVKLRPLISCLNRSTSLCHRRECPLTLRLIRSMRLCRHREGPLVVVQNLRG